MLEIEQLNDAKVKVGFKKLSVRDTAIRLGISMGAYDNYNVLTRYNAVINAYEQGLSNSFIKTKKLVLEVESTYKKDHQKSVLNVSDKNNINDKINSLLSGIKEPVQIQKAYKVSPIQSVTTIKTLLSTNIMELDTGINWHDVDWGNHAEVTRILSRVIDYLEKE